MRRKGAGFKLGSSISWSERAHHGTCTNFSVQESSRKIIVMGIGIAVVTWDPLKAIHSQCLQTRSRASTNPNLCHSRIFQVTSMRLWRWPAPHSPVSPARIKQMPRRCTCHASSASIHPLASTSWSWYRRYCCSDTLGARIHDSHPERGHQRQKHHRRKSRRVLRPFLWSVFQPGVPACSM